MINLLKETMLAVSANHYHVDDIIFIGSEKSGHSCTWQEFQKLANFEYDEDFGRQNVANDLVIAFHDGAQLLREAYDGREWWKLIQPFVMPEKQLKISRVFGDGYVDDQKKVTYTFTLSDVN